MNPIALLFRVFLRQCTLGNAVGPTKTKILPHIPRNIRTDNAYMVFRPILRGVSVLCWHNSPNRVLSVGVLAAKIAPMGGRPGLARRRTVVFMILRGHDLTHSAAVSLAIFVSL